MQLRPRKAQRCAPTQLPFGRNGGTVDTSDMLERSLTHHPTGVDSLRVRVTGREQLDDGDEHPESTHSTLHLDQRYQRGETAIEKIRASEEYRVVRLAPSGNSPL